MASMDLKNNLLVAHALAPAARTDGTATGTFVDLFGYEGAMVIFNAGAWTDGTHTPSLQDSDDGTTGTAVSAGNLQGTFTAVSSTTQHNAAYQVGYKGSKRYIRPMLVTASSTTGALSAASIVKGYPRIAPAT